MGRAGVPLDTLWPDGSEPKTLICVQSQCSAAEMFSTLFGESDLSAQLHKQRGDTDLVVSPWVTARGELPTAQYTWQPPGPSNEPSEELRFRKVRFESPPTALASKPFQNEEVQVIIHLHPDTHYVVEAASSTSAPYGDKFTVFFRYTLIAGPAAAAAAAGGGGGGDVCCLLVSFHIEFTASMNRMMKPVVGKAIDAGVRGTFRLYRQLLGGLRQCSDIRETDMPHTPGEEVGLDGAGADEVVAGEEEEAPAAAVGMGSVGGKVPGVAGVRMQAHPGAAAGAAGAAGGLVDGLPPGSLLSVVAQQLVYKEQPVVVADLVRAGLRSVTQSYGSAQILAALLTLWLVSIAVTAIRGWQAMCALPHVGDSAEGGGGVEGGPLWLAVLRFGMCWPLALIDLPDSTTEVLTSLVLVGAINWAVILGSVATVQYLGQIQPSGLVAVGRAEEDGGGGGKEESGAGGEQEHLEAPAEAGPPAEAAPAVPLVAKAPASASPKSNGAGKAGAAAAPSSGVKVPAAPKATSASRPLRAAPAPRQFSAAQLRQLELGQINSSSAAVNRRAAAPPPAPPVGSAAATISATAGVTDAVAAMASMPDAWAADLSVGMVTADTSKLSGSPMSPPSAFATAGGSVPLTTEAAGGGTATSAAVPTPVALSPSSKVPQAGMAAGAAVASTSPSAPYTAASFANMFTKEGIDSMAESLRSAFRWAADGTDGPPPSTTITSPDLPASPATRGTGSFAKARSDTSGDAVALTSRPATSAHRSTINHFPPTAAATAVRSGGGSAGSATQLATQISSAHFPFLSSIHSDTPLLGVGAASEGGVESEWGLAGGAFGSGLEGEGGGGGVDEPGVVVEEVFENERFQPFRGWGHMWPGHFLPSDRVGHWSDRQGKPGGSASMVFDQVVPPLPPGWRWLEENWQIDLDGMDSDCVDADGWTYALDFYLLKYPPPAFGGKCSLKHFVRRRRYFRTRAREESSELVPLTSSPSLHLAQPPTATTTCLPTSSGNIPSGEGEGEGEGDCAGVGMKGGVAVPPAGGSPPHRPGTSGSSEGGDVGGGAWEGAVEGAERLQLAEGRAAGGSGGTRSGSNGSSGSSPRGVGVPIPIGTHKHLLSVSEGQEGGGEDGGLGREGAGEEGLGRSFGSSTLSSLGAAARVASSGSGRNSPAAGVGAVGSRAGARGSGGVGVSAASRSDSSTLPRPRSAPAAAVYRHHQQEEEDAVEGAGGGGGEGVQVEATLALLGSSPKEGAAAVKAGDGAVRQRYDDVRQQQQQQGGAGGFGGGEGFVLSPKTMMTSHDPLGALLEGAVAGVVEAQQPPVVVREAAAAAAAGLGVDEEVRGTTPAAKAAAPATMAAPPSGPAAAAKAERNGSVQQPRPLSSSSGRGMAAAAGVVMPATVHPFASVEEAGMHQAGAGGGRMGAGQDAQEEEGRQAGGGAGGRGAAGGSGSGNGTSGLEAGAAGMLRAGSMRRVGGGAAAGVGAGSSSRGSVDAAGLSAEGPIVAADLVEM